MNVNLKLIKKIIIIMPHCHTSWSIMYIKKKLVKKINKIDL